MSASPQSSSGPPSAPDSHAVEQAPKATPPSAPARAVRRHARGLALAAMLVAGCSMALVSTFGYGRDQGIYGVVARAVLDGGMPYRDVWDFKPPGIFLVYALSRALFGPAEWGIRVLEVAGLGAMTLGMVVLARRWWQQGLIGLLAAAIATLIHAQLDFWHTGQPESFGGMLTIGGLVLGTSSALGRRRFAHWVAAGVLFGCAGLLKPPLAGGGAVLALFAAAQLGWSDEQSGDGTTPLKRRLARAAQPIGAVLLGGILPFALCVSWFAARGALGDLYQTLFVFTPHYTALGWEDRAFPGMVYQAFAQWLVSYSSLVAVGMLLLLAAGRATWRRPGVFLLLGVISIQLVGVAMQGKYFPYHYGAVWPATALLAALGWWTLWQHSTRRGLPGVAVFAVAICVVGALRTATKDLADSFWSRTWERGSLFLVGPQEQARIDALASVADVDAGANRAAALLLRRMLPEGQSVYVWGFEPVIYELSERPAASRFIYNVPQRVEWSADSMRAALMNELRAKPPGAIVVAHNDLLPAVTGDLIDSAIVLENFPALSALLEERYLYFERVDDLDVYLERP